MTGSETRNNLRWRGFRIMAILTDDDLQPPGCFVQFRQLHHRNKKNIIYYYSVVWHGVDDFTSLTIVNNSTLEITMNIKTKVLSMSLLATLMAANAAWAEPIDGAKGDVKFQGNVIESACNIDAQNLHQTVQFGEVGKTVLANGGNQSIPFQIQLTGCDPDATVNGQKIGTVGIKFEGGTGEELFSPDIDGYAKGVSVKVYSDDLAGFVKFDGSTPAKKAISKGEMNYTFKAILAKASAATTDAITVGKVDTKAMFAVSYE